jgi:FkbM family methyltransferase
MIINKNLKSFWKVMMRPFLRIYSGSPSLIIINDPKFLPKKQYYSQFGQDIFVFEYVFKQKNNGLFVDIGGNHPIKDNNTYILEKNGWKGFAVEPQDFLRKIWPENRETECLPFVIGEDEKDVVFVEGDDSEHGLSGVDSYNKRSDDSKKTVIKQRSLSSILAEKDIKRIDYLSIDVEGYEMNVLRGVDFSKFEIELVGVENDGGFDYIPFIGKKIGSEFGDNKIRKYLKDRGYKYIARIFCDDFFLKEK